MKGFVEAFLKKTQGDLEGANPERVTRSGDTTTLTERRMERGAKAKAAFTQDGVKESVDRLFDNRENKELDPECVVILMVFPSPEKSTKDQIAYVATSSIADSGPGGVRSAINVIQSRGWHSGPTQGA